MDFQNNFSSTAEADGNHFYPKMNTGQVIPFNMFYKQTHLKDKGAIFTIFVPIVKFCLKLMTVVDLFLPKISKFSLPFFNQTRFM